MIRAYQDLFAWLHRHHLTITGPTIEDHLTDTDGAHATILEIPCTPTSQTFGHEDEPTTSPGKPPRTTTDPAPTTNPTHPL